MKYIYLILFLIVPLHAQSTFSVPVTCKIGYGSANYEEVPCNLIRTIEILAIPKVWNNVCLFKNNIWQLGRLQPRKNNPGKYTFISERTCSSGVTAQNLRPALNQVFGPRTADIKYEFSGASRMTASLNNSHPSGMSILEYNSFPYYTASDPDVSVTLTGVSSAKVLMACRVKSGHEHPCVNSDPGSSPNDVGFCEQIELRDSSNPAAAYVEDSSGRGYRGRWYVRYTQKFKSSFEVCFGGIKVATATTLAQTNKVNIQRILGVNDVLSSTFLNSWGSGLNGTPLNNGLRRWYNNGVLTPETDYGTKRLQQITTCYTTEGGQEVRNSCSGKILYTSLTPPTSTTSGRCYAYKNGGSWTIQYDDGGEVLKTCDKVEVVRRIIVKP